jgi:hypothetical protein
MSGFGAAKLARQMCWGRNWLLGQQPRLLHRLWRVSWLSGQGVCPQQSPLGVLFT